MCDLGVVAEFFLAAELPRAVYEGRVVRPVGVRKRSRQRDVAAGFVLDEGAKGEVAIEQQQTHDYHRDTEETGDGQETLQSEGRLVRKRRGTGCRTVDCAALVVAAAFAQAGSGNLLFHYVWF